MVDHPSIIARLRAGGIHLAISALVAACVVALIFLVWYPAPLAETQGVSRLLLILIAVDVTVGPLITVLIFNRNKKSLRFDLAVVGCCQLAFLAYGLHAIHTGRPAIIAYNVDRFDVVQAQDVDRDSLRRAMEAGKPGLPFWRPRVVFARLPDDQRQRGDLLFQSVFGGSDLPQMAEWYEPYADGSDVVLKHLRPLAELQKINRMDTTQWQRFLDSLGQRPSALAYLPLKGKTSDGIVIVDAATADIVRIELLEPRW